MPSSGAIIAGAAYLKISLDSAEFASGLENVKSRFQKFAAGVNHWADQMQYIGTMLAVPIAGAVKKFEQFDTRMRHVQAVTHSTGAEFARLTTYARKLGRETSYTTNEVADSMLALGRMGFNTKEITDATSHVMNLARATGSELALSAKVAANMLRVFGKEASHTEHFADVMVTVVNNSAQTLDDFAQAVSWSGPKFKMFGESFETMSAALGVLANMGIKGSLAGNSIGRGLVQLSDSSVIDYLRNLNIQVVNANGNLKPYLENLREIAAAMKTMNTQQQMEMLKTVFGMRGMLGNTPLAINMDAIDTMLEKIQDLDGAAADAMKNIEGGIMGVLARLKSAIDDFSIEFGQLFYNTFKDFLVSFTEATKSVTKFISEFKGAISVFLKFGSVAFAVAAVAKTFNLLRYSIKTLLSPLLAVQSVMNNLGAPNLAKESAVASAKWARYNYEKQDKKSAQALTNHQAKIREAEFAKNQLKNATDSKEAFGRYYKERKEEIDNETKNKIQNVRTKSKENISQLNTALQANEDKMKQYNKAIRAKQKGDEDIAKIKSKKKYKKYTSDAYLTPEETIQLNEQRTKIDRLQSVKSYNHLAIKETAGWIPELRNKIWAKTPEDIQQFTSEDIKSMRTYIDGIRSRYYQRLLSAKKNYQNIKNYTIDDLLGKGPHTQEDIDLFGQMKKEDLADAFQKVQKVKEFFNRAKKTRRSLQFLNKRIKHMQGAISREDAIKNSPEFIEASKKRELTEKQQEDYNKLQKDISDIETSDSYKAGIEAEQNKDKLQKEIEEQRAKIQEETDARDKNIEGIKQSGEQEKENLEHLKDTAKSRQEEAKAASEVADKAEKEAGKIAKKEQNITNAMRENAEAQEANVKTQYGDSALLSKEKQIEQSRLSFDKYVDGIKNGTVAMSRGQVAANNFVQAINKTGNASLFGAACTFKHAKEVWNLSIKDTAAALAVQSNSKRRAISYLFEATKAKVAAGATIALQSAMSFLKGNAIVLGISAITAAFAAMAQALQNNIKYMNEWRESVANVTGQKLDEKEKKRNSRNDLIKKYDDLEDNNLTDEYKQNVIKQIVEENPELGSYNEGKYSLNSKNKDEFVEAVNALYKKRAESATSEAASSATQAVKALGKELIERRNKEAGYLNSRKLWTDIVGEGRYANPLMTKANAKIKPLEDMLKILDPNFSISFDTSKINQYKGSIKDAQEKLIFLNDEFNNLANEYELYEGLGKEDSKEAIAIKNRIANIQKEYKDTDDLIKSLKMQLEKIAKPGEAYFNFEEFRNKSISEQKAQAKKFRSALQFNQQNEDLVTNWNEALESFVSIANIIENMAKDAEADIEIPLQNTKQKQYEDRQKRANDLANQRKFIDAKDAFYDADKNRQNDKLIDEYANLGKASPFDASQIMERERDFAKVKYENEKKQYKDFIEKAEKKGYFNGTMPIDEQEEYNQKIEYAKQEAEKARAEYLKYEEAYKGFDERKEEFVRSKNKKYEDRAYSKMTDEQKMSYDVGKASFLNSVIGKIFNLLPQAEANILNERYTVNGNEQQAVADRNKLLEDLFRAQEQLEDTRFRIEDSRENMLNNRQTETVGSFSAKALNRSLSGNNYQQKSYEEAQKIRGFVSSIAGALNLNNRQIAELLQRWGVAY